MQNNSMMMVRVCYPDAAGLASIDVFVPFGCSIKTAIESSGILLQSPVIDLTSQKVGVFGKLKTLDAQLHPNDRVEIYRPLLADPMEARRRRALKQVK